MWATRRSEEEEVVAPLCLFTGANQGTALPNPDRNTDRQNRDSDPAWAFDNQA